MKLTLIIIVLLISFNSAQAQSIEFAGDTDDIGVTQVGNSDLKFSVSRNPVNGDFGVDLDKKDGKDVDVMLTDLNGRILESHHVKDSKDSSTINFSHNRLTKGTYVIKVSDHHIIQKAKVVIS